jgi:hypothetical protein
VNASRGRCLRRDEPATVAVRSHWLSGRRGLSRHHRTPDARYPSQPGCHRPRQRTRSPTATRGTSRIRDQRPDQYQPDSALSPDGVLYHVPEPGAARHDSFRCKYPPHERLLAMVAERVSGAPSRAPVRAYPALLGVARSDSDPEVSWGAATDPSIGSLVAGRSVGLHARLSGAAGLRGVQRTARSSDQCLT